MKIGIIGSGNMGSAIAERIKSKYEVIVFDKDKTKTAGLKDIEVSEDAEKLVRDAGAVILAVKPQDFAGLLTEIKNSGTGKLFISIAAGITTAYIEERLGNARVMRVMPNLGIKIAQSVTCLSKGKSAAEGDFRFAKEFFGYLGVTREINENLMNAATAISGSGPGFIFYFMEAESLDSNNVGESFRQDITEKLKSAAESVGFNTADAEFLAKNTVSAALGLLNATKVSPGELRAQVTSKGGTTEAGLRVLSEGGSWAEAAQAALERAEELSRK